MILQNLKNVVYLCIFKIFSSSALTFFTFGSLLSRSGDSTARIWPIPDGSSRSGLQNGALNVLVLKHVRGRTNEKSKDVTTLDWNVSLVTLLYDKGYPISCNIYIYIYMLVI